MVQINRVLNIRLIINKNVVLRGLMQKDLINFKFQNKLVALKNGDNVR